MEICRHRPFAHAEIILQYWRRVRASQGISTSICLSPAKSSEVTTLLYSTTEEVTIPNKLHYSRLFWNLTNKTNLILHTPEDITACYSGWTSNFNQQTMSAYLSQRWPSRNTNRLLIHSWVAPHSGRVVASCMHSSNAPITYFSNTILASDNWRLPHERGMFLCVPIVFLSYFM